MDTLQPSVGAYALYRVAGHLELHLNGTVLANTDLSDPNQSTSNSEDVYVGVNDINGLPADSIEAVIAIRGSIDSMLLNQLERFLSMAFSVGPR